MTNSIYFISPYRDRGVWCFDDASVGLRREAFVTGADKIIDRLVADAGLQDPGSGFSLLFSSVPFPGHAARLDHIRHDDGGDYYLWRDRQIEGWLCPALRLYFAEAPASLYVLAVQGGAS